MFLSQFNRFKTVEEVDNFHKKLTRDEYIYFGNIIAVLHSLPSKDQSEKFLELINQETKQKVEQIKRDYESKLSEKKETISNLEQEKSHLCGQVVVLQKVYDTLESKKTQSSAIIGRNGEEYIKKLLVNSRFFDITRTSGLARSGDLIINMKGDSTLILVEIKNRKTTVPLQEVNKFKTDVDSNSNVAGGILVSLISKASTQYEEIKVHRTEAEDKPIIFIDSFMDRDKDSGLIELKYAAQTIQQICIAKSDQSESTLQRAINALDSNLSNMNKTPNFLSEMKKSLNKIVASIDAQLFIYKKEQRQNAIEVKEIKEMAKPKKPHPMGSEAIDDIDDNEEDDIQVIRQDPEQSGHTIKRYHSSEEQNEKNITKVIRLDQSVDKKSTQGQSCISNFFKHKH
jgi:hypothetical protein